MTSSRNLFRLMQQKKKKDFEKRKKAFLSEYRELAMKYKCDWMIDQFVIDIADKMEAIETAKKANKESDIEIISP